MDSNHKMIVNGEVKRELRRSMPVEGPLRDVLQPLLGDNVGASVAHYFRRALEGVIATIGLMIFMDFVKPGRMSEVAGKTRTAVVSR